MTASRPVALLTKELAEILKYRGLNLAEHRIVADDQISDAIDAIANGDAVVVAAADAAPVDLDRIREALEMVAQSPKGLGLSNPVLHAVNTALSLLPQRGEER